MKTKIFKLFCMSIAFLSLNSAFAQVQDSKKLSDLFNDPYVAEELFGAKVLAANRVDAATFKVNYERKLVEDTLSTEEPGEYIEACSFSASVNVACEIQVSDIECIKEDYSTSCEEKEQCFTEVQLLKDTLNCSLREIPSDDEPDSGGGKGKGRKK